MGMYTEIFVNVNLKPETPDDVLNVLHAMCGDDSKKEALADKPARWECLFNNGSYYTPLTSCAKLTFDNIAKHWSLLGKGDIKNYYLNNLHTASSAEIQVCGEGSSFCWETGKISPSMKQKSNEKSE